MNKFLRHITLLTIALLALASCDVHEYPGNVDRTAQFVLHLRYDTEMPIYQEIRYLTSRNPENEEPRDVRYIINAYRRSETRDVNRIPDATFVFTRPATEGLDYDAVLNLEPGEYQFLVWTDYVLGDTQTDYFYNTDDFAEIQLTSKSNYVGSTDKRDTFRGELTTSLYNVDELTGSFGEATIDMRRPMAKFKFISTDYPEFVRQMLMRQAKKDAAEGKAPANDETRTIDPDDYNVVFRYSGFMPCSFNMFNNKPADSWTGVAFSSRLVKINEQEAELGFDYVFVNGSEAKVSVCVEVYDSDNNLLANINPIEVPLVRSQLTIVRGEFLTSKATGGVGIVPDFDGEYNIVIP